MSFLLHRPPHMGHTIFMVKVGHAGQLAIMAVLW